MWNKSVRETIEILHFPFTFWRHVCGYYYIHLIRDDCSVLKVPRRLQQHVVKGLFRHRCLAHTLNYVNIIFVPRTAVKNNFRVLTSWHQHVLLWWRSTNMLSFCISARLSMNMYEDGVSYRFCNICSTICWWSIYSLCQTISDCPLSVAESVSFSFRKKRRRRD